MLDDIIEIGIEVLGEILEAVFSSRRTKRAKGRKAKDIRQEDPWTRSDQAAPWEK